MKIAENLVRYFTKGVNEWYWIYEILVENFLTYWG